MIGVFVLIFILILIPSQVRSSGVCQYAVNASATSESTDSKAIYAIGLPNTPTSGECTNWSGPGYTWSPANWNVTANLTLRYNTSVYVSNFTIFGDYDIYWKNSDQKNLWLLMV